MKPLSQIGNITALLANSSIAESPLWNKPVDHIGKYNLAAIAPVAGRLRLTLAGGPRRICSNTARSSASKDVRAGFHLWGRMSTYNKPQT